MTPLKRVLYVHIVESQTAMRTKQNKIGCLLYHTYVPHFAVLSSSLSWRHSDFLS